jgi:hypothetical protein
MLVAFTDGVDTDIVAVADGDEVREKSRDWRIGGLETRK